MRLHRPALRQSFQALHHARPLRRRQWRAVRVVGCRFASAKKSPPTIRVRSRTPLSVSFACASVTTCGR
ncbi:hypothetical protein ACWEV4_34305, partial [Streptomyces sp. NPDC003860]